MGSLALVASLRQTHIKANTTSAYQLKEIIIRNIGKEEEVNTVTLIILDNPKIIETRLYDQI